jgi:hypothetical protein
MRRSGDEGGAVEQPSRRELVPLVVSPIAPSVLCRAR